jgi:hypothetical protein
MSASLNCNGVITIPQPVGSSWIYTVEFPYAVFGSGPKSVHNARVAIKQPKRQTKASGTRTKKGGATRNSPRGLEWSSVAGFHGTWMKQRCQAPEKLRFTAWEIFHAACKTRYEKVSAGLQLQFAAAAFGVLYGPLFNWSGSDGIELDAGASSMLKDSEHSATSGRFGEAFLHLVMMSKGFIYWDHLPRFYSSKRASFAHSWEIKSKVASIVGFKRGNDREPDYVFEKSSGELALGEAKGKICDHNGSSSIVADLDGALAQLAPWMSRLSPAPANAFATSTCLVEPSSTEASSHPSVIAWVDPPGDQVRGDDLPRADLVRRGNYAHWLELMGLYRAAEAVRLCRSAQLPKRPFRTIMVAGREYLFLGSSAVSVASSVAWVPDWWRLIDPDKHDFQSDSRAFTPLLIGLDCEVASALEDVIARGESAELRVVREVRSVRAPEGRSMSIFPDGSMIADVSVVQFPTIREFAI